MPETGDNSETGFDLPLRIVWEPDDKEMVLIPGGKFVIGNDDGPEMSKPQSEIILKPFYVDLYPVTQADYNRFVQATGHPIPCYDVEWVDSSAYNWHPEIRTPPEDKLDHPVVMVTWEDACGYCEWAQKRLPTEAEWERAARGTDGRRWPWGDEFREECCNSRGSGIGRTTAVYRYCPIGDSPDGVCDMVGNVWEWTSSLHWPYPYDPQDGREDPDASGWRVLRGGSWLTGSTMCSATSRLDADFLLYTNVGFRCAISADIVLAALEICDESVE